MRPTATSGFSLIEVLVAIVVLSIGVLGVVAVQTLGVRANHDALLRSQALALASDMVERMHANRPAVAAMAYADVDSAGGAISCATPPSPYCEEQAAGPAEPCTPQQMAQHDQYVVFCGYPASSGRAGGVQDLLPGGRLRVECLDAPCTALSRHRVTVSWQSRNSEGDVETASVRIAFTP